MATSDGVDVDAAAIRARAERMPAGPLTVKNADVIDTDGRAIAVAQDWGDWLADRDVAEFIAHAPTDIRVLLGALVVAEQQRDDALAKIARVEAWADDWFGPRSQNYERAETLFDAALTDPRPPNATPTAETVPPRVAGTGGPQNPAQSRGGGE